MALLRYLVEGFIAKLITGADDTLTHTPIITSLTKKKTCKIIFLLGMLFSIIALIILSALFSRVLVAMPYRNIIGALLLFALAVMVYTNHIVHKGREKYSHWIKKVPEHFRRISFFGMGFLTFFATGIDDVIVYSTLMANGFPAQIYIGIGILAAAVVEFVIVFYFSKLLSRVKHIEKMTVAGLIVLAVLVALNVI